MIQRRKRGRKGSQRLDLAPLRRALHDRRVWAQLAIVTRGPGATSHFRRSGDDVLVDVETVPGGLDLTCRLGSFAGGPSMGLWRIPAEGTEVAVLVADGDPTFMPTIVGTLSTGAVPTKVTNATGTYLVASDKIEIVVGGRTLRVTGSNIDLGEAATQKVPKGDVLNSKLTSILTEILGHTHSGGGSGPPNNAAAFTALISQLSQILSGTVRVE